MKSKVFITFCLIFTLLTSLILTSCGDRDYDEEEVISASRELLQKSIVVNEVFYGEGIRYDADTNLSNGYYYPALDQHLLELGFSNIDELKALTESVYTKELSNLIFSTKLTSVEDDDYIISVARYYQRNDGVIDCIMVYSEADVLYRNGIEYLYDTLKVIGAEGEYIKISVDVKLTDGESDEETINLELMLLEEENGFRLDTFSFAGKNDN